MSKLTELEAHVAIRPGETYAESDSWAVLVPIGDMRKLVAVARVATQQLDVHSPSCGQVSSHCARCRLLGALAVLEISQ
jgi:hypothetical protein